MITSDEIKRRLWDGANELRGSMDASRYKDYMLGLMFYKFLSDKTLETFKSNLDLSGLSDVELIKEYEKARNEYGEELDRTLQSILGYYVAPEFLYQTWIDDISKGDFEVQKVIDSLNNFEKTVATSGDTNDFKGLFSSSTLDLSDTALGSNLNERSKNIKALILLFSDLNMVALQKGDVLGDAYEYLIGQFAMESGKKAGEFYTPRQVSEVMAQIVAKSTSIKSIYDPAVGSGSLLLTVGKHMSIDDQKNLNYYGQEKNTATYNLTRMNLLLHGVRPDKMTIKNGDTLTQDWPEDPERPNEGVLFDSVVMNPPYSAKNWNKAGLKVSDPRFEIAGTLPPDSKGDFAFLLHGLFHLGPNGTMAIVLPHGVLFRGSSEGEIRKRLLEKNYIDTIIGLPSNLFTNTGIPVVVIILKKNRIIDEPVLIIDASSGFTKMGKQNVLREKDIAKIVDTYVDRRKEEGYSHLAYRDEIVQNEYNMNIPRYVARKDEEIPHDVDAHLFGGIPQKNIDDLRVLQSLVPEVLHNAIETVREGYVELIKDIDTITDEVLSNQKILCYEKEIENQIGNYIDKYWRILRDLDKNIDISNLMQQMLAEIKEVLSSHDYIDVYNGYQIIAEIWKNALTHDAELVSLSGFYVACKTREPNMVTKGSGSSKREEQDGWIGSVIPNVLISKHLYKQQLERIEDSKSQIQNIEGELTELIEAAKSEETEENSVLFDVLRKDEDDEPLDSFENKSVKLEIKKYDKGTPEYNMLKKVDTLLNDKSELGKTVKRLEKEVNIAVQERILKLTDNEINELVFEKWFGNTIEAVKELARTPLIEELKLLKTLHTRYADTLSSIDEESKSLEEELNRLLNDLVVI